jgi:hypothetical protein
MSIMTNNPDHDAYNYFPRSEGEGECQVDRASL